MDTHAQFIRRIILVPAVCFSLIFLQGTGVAQAAPDPQAAETVRDLTFQAQKEMYAAAGASNPGLHCEAAASLVGKAAQLYNQALHADLATLAPLADQIIVTELDRAGSAAANGDARALAAARGRLWTGLLWGSHDATLHSLKAGRIEDAAEWLRLREYRQATAAAAVDSPAAEAIVALQAGGMEPVAALAAVGDDLRDAYFFRLREALAGMEEAAGKNFAARASEQAGQAKGYFAILRADFAAKQGDREAASVAETLDGLERAALAADWPRLKNEVAVARQALADYLPVELTDAEVGKRGQLLYLFINLVYVEYKDGVRDGEVTIPIEYQEAITFRDQAATIFEELRPVIATRNNAAAERLSGLLAEMEIVMRDLGDKEQVRTLVDEALSLVKSTLAVQIDADDPMAAFTVMNTLLDEMLIAVEQGRYADAERTRLEAYAVFESGPEQRLAFRKPKLSRELEGLFWEGTSGEKGLAALLHAEAPPAEIEAGIGRLKTRLADAEDYLAAGLSGIFAALNSAVIIIREGLEAVLIVGAILGYLRVTQRPKKYSQWTYAGVAAAVLLSLLTWWAARSLITISVANRELIEGVASLLAVAVLFYVTNWLFHKVYVVGWMTFVKEQVGKALGSGSAFTLAVLGFTVVYREGFETVLFYQALLFDADAIPVLLGFLAGAALIVAVAFAILRLSKRLPLKPFFTVTGVLLLLLAFNFSGAGVRELQEAGVIGATFLAWMPENILLMEVFGLFPTAQTMLAQAAFLLAVIATFYYSRRRSRRTAPVEQAQLDA